MADDPRRGAFGLLGALVDAGLCGYVVVLVARGVRQLLARRRGELGRFGRPGAAGPRNFTEGASDRHASPGGPG